MPYFSKNQRRIRIRFIVTNLKNLNIQYFNTLKPFVKNLFYVAVYMKNKRAGKLSILFNTTF